MRSAGTSANVYIQIYGSEIATQQKMLCHSKERDGKFKRGKKDKFVVELEDVGDPIEKIRIGHDGSGIGSGWHLDQVEIRRLLEDESVSGFSKQQEDGKLLFYLLWIFRLHHQHLDISVNSCSIPTQEVAFLLQFDSTVM